MRVKEILKEKGVTAKELAVKLGMTETGLSIAISDKGNPPLKRLQEIASALGVDVIELFDKPTAGNFTCPNCGAVLVVKAKDATRQPVISANIKTKIDTLKDKYSQATSAGEFDAIGDELLKLCDEIENLEQF